METQWGPSPTAAPPHFRPMPIVAIMPPQRKRRTSSFAAARGNKSAGMTFPLEIAPSHRGSGPHLIHGSLGPPDRVLNPNGISIGPAVFVRLTSVTV